QRLIEALACGLDDRTCLAVTRVGDHNLSRVDPLSVEPLPAQGQHDDEAREALTKGRYRIQRSRRQLAKRCQTFDERAELLKMFVEKAVESVVGFFRANLASHRRMKRPQLF